MFDLQTCGGVGVVLCSKLGGHLELAVGGRVVFGAQFGPVTVTLGPAALLGEKLIKNSVLIIYFGHL